MGQCSDTNFNQINLFGEQVQNTALSQHSNILPPRKDYSFEANMYRGYVKLWRKSKDWAFYQQPLALALWVNLIMEANHKITRKIFNGNPIDIQPGQILTGRKYLSNISGISESSIERLLNKFEKDKQIEQQKTNINRLITIVNWDKYQNNEQQTDNKRTTDDTTNGQPTDTPNNVKNDKNEKNDNKTEFEKTIDAFIEMRKKIKKPLTEHATKLLINELTKLAGTDESLKIKILNQSIMNSWQGVFPLKENTSQPKKDYTIQFKAIGV